MASGRVLRSGKVTVITVEEPGEKQRQVGTPSTRFSSEVYLVGHSPPGVIGSKMPTNGQAFQYFLHVKNEEPNQYNWSLAYQMIDTVIPFWNMARIKTKVCLDRMQCCIS